MIPSKHSFHFISRKNARKIILTRRLKKQGINSIQVAKNSEKLAALNADKDDNKRAFLKFAGLVSLGVFASSLIPKKAEALVFGSTPASNVVGLKNDSDIRINPATDETLSSLISGQGIKKLTANLSVSGVVLMPPVGKKIRVYASRFSLSSDANSVSFRFTSGGADHEKYISPKSGGLYGANNHPNYIEGGVNEDLYCVIIGTTIIQVNIDYLEI